MNRRTTERERKRERRKRIGGRKKNGERVARRSHLLRVLHFPRHSPLLRPSRRENGKYGRVVCRDALWNLINTKWICPVVVSGSMRVRDGTRGWTRKPRGYKASRAKRTAPRYTAEIGCWPSSPSRFAPPSSASFSFVIVQCCRS